MSLRDLIEPDCGGANALMRLGGHMIRDVAYKDEGLSHGAGPSFVNRPQHFEDEQLIQDFQRQLAMPPQTFRMDAILQEMREIDAKNFASQVKRAPPVIEEVNAGLAWTNEYLTENQGNAGPTRPMLAEAQNSGIDWSKEFVMSNEKGPFLNEVLLPRGPSIQAPQSQSDYSTWTSEFFDIHESVQKLNINDEIQKTAGEIHEKSTEDPEQFKYSEFMNFMKNVSDGDIKVEDTASSWAKEFAINEGVAPESMANWVEEFAQSREDEIKATDNYNSQFWNRLQDEWKKISEDSDKHPWLSEFTDYYDPYKEYTFDEENPMADLENAFEKGKQFLAAGDIPSAVLCFESAVKQDPNNAEIWQLLGQCQAENEKDPNAIAALKRSLELNPGNANVLMSLAVSYTNESLQSQALSMLVTWLKGNEKYSHLVPPNLGDTEAHGATAPSFTQGPDLREVQDIFLQAVQQNQPVIDADIQEALGVLFNLSSDYDKAADCFRAAVNVNPDNAKTWNRLGASLANGNHSIEAVDAYQRALQIEPGFVRARYNVGIICINLKAYNEAAEHFLIALNHQATSLQRSGLTIGNTTNQMSDTIWSTLRMVISLMGRLDLQPAIDNRDLNILNKAFEASD